MSDPDFTANGRWPVKGSLVQAFINQNETATIPDQHLKTIATPVSEVTGENKASFSEQTLSVILSPV